MSKLSDNEAPLRSASFNHCQRANCKILQDIDIDIDISNPNTLVRPRRARRRSVIERRHVRCARDHRLADRPGAFCCSDACVAASTCQEFVTRKLGKLTRASLTEQNAQHQSLQRDFASGSCSADRRPSWHRHRQGCHQEIQQPRDMVMVATYAATTFLLSVIRPRVVARGLCDIVIPTWRTPNECHHVLLLVCFILLPSLFLLRNT